MEHTVSVRQRDRMQVAAGRTHALNQHQKRVPRLAGVAASSRADAKAASQSTFRPPSQPGEPGPQHPAHARLQLRAGRGTVCSFIIKVEKTLESPLDCKEIQPVHPKENQS